MPLDSPGKLEAGSFGYLSVPTTHIPAMSRRPPIAALLAVAIATASAALTTGCGTTRSTDTNRTATEQLLISDAIDRAVQTVNIGALAGQTVYLDDSKLGDVVDKNYLISTLRQHLLASGCALRDQREEADFVVEARAGAIGTDRNDLLFGVPSMNVPQIMPMQPTPAAIPEIPIAKRRDQRGIAKIAVFAYHRQTGQPVWQSGAAHQESSSNDVWILGAGPFQRGTIYEGTEFAGKALRHDDEDESTARPPTAVALDQRKLFTSPERLASLPEKAQDEAVAQAAHTEPTSPNTQPAEKAAASAAPAASIESAPTAASNEAGSAAIDFDRPLSDYLPKADTDRDDATASVYQWPFRRAEATSQNHASPDRTPADVR